MAKTELKFVWTDDEHCDIYINDSYAGEMDHGPHGWDGMVGIRDVMMETARLLDWEVVIAGDEGI